MAESSRCGFLKQSTTTGAGQPETTLGDDPASTQYAGACRARLGHLERARLRTSLQRRVASHVAPPLAVFRR